MDAEGESKNNNHTMRKDLTDTQRRKVQFQLMDTNRMLDIAKHVYFGLVKRRSAYLTDKGLKQLNIKCTGLDLSTGKPSDGSDIFIRPFSISRIREIMAPTPNPEVEELSEPYTFSRWHAAFAIAHRLIDCLTCYRERDPPLICHTDWQTRGVQHAKGERLERRERIDNRGPDWRVDDVLDKMDGLTPHVSCVLIDHAPLRDTQLSNSEIWCIVAITYRRMQLPEYRNHRIIPVTVISVGDRQVRIVQGYIDTEEGCVRARKSPVFDFNRDDPMQVMEILLSWCMGETVGNTKA
ncbi:hypothetical protein GGR51DRAFT_476807 [Nemania sp. FL0031]|nr:hypothetical protein GGR51DRAFT_476807 [Nemania sp. FL0031]